MPGATLAAMRKINLKAIVQYLIFLGLGIGLIWYSARELTPEQLTQLKNSWRLTRFVYIIPVALLMFLAHYSRALRWIILMKPLGYKPGITNTFLAVLLGYFFNMLVPRLGEVMKCTVLAKYEKVAPEKLVGTILAERAIDFLSLIAVAILMVALQFDRIGPYAMQTLMTAAGNQGGNVSWVKIILGLLAAGAAVALAWYLFKKFRSHRLMQRVTAIAGGIWQGIKSVRDMEQKSVFLFHTVAIWAMYLGGIWVGFMAFPPVAHLGLDASLSVLVFGSLGMIATQGGIGAYQIAVEKTLLKFGITSVMGLAFGWLIWGAQTAIVLAGGIAAMLLLPVVNRKKP